MLIKVSNIKSKEVHIIPKFIKENLPEEKYFHKKLLNDFLKETTIVYLKNLFRERGSIFLKAEENNELVGILYAKNDYGIIWIEFIDVKKDHRMEHIASNLLKKLEKICIKRKMHKIHTDIPTTNLPSLKTFKENKYFIEAKLKKHWLKFDYYLLSKFI